MTPSPHISVMLNEVIAALDIKDNGVYVDGTFGRGGYSRGILEAAQATVYGIDRDPDAIRAGQEMIAHYAPRLHLLEGNFAELDHLLHSEHIQGVDGITLDLGVSSPQLDEAERGFSFQADGPLDMRMSKSGTTAADLVNSASEKDLADIIFNFGEERYARRVARRIVAERATNQITRTQQLATIVRQTVPRSNDGVDPATRTFQALRIAVNDELGAIEKALHAATQLLKPNGRLAIVSFHSLEDRIVKNFLRAHSSDAPRASRHAPANDSYDVKPSFNLITKKPQLPSDLEVTKNPRARSARLRVAMRTDAPAPKEYAA